MNGRRRHPRFVLSHPLEGELHIRDEVSIERYDGREVMALSPVACRPGEMMVLEIPDESETALTVRVEENSPCVASDGRVLHRVRLAIEPSPVEMSQRGRTKA